MRAWSIPAVLLLHVACEGDRAGPRLVDDVVVGACVWDVGGGPYVEVVFDATFDLDCQRAPRTWCEVTLDGDRLVVTGEASRRGASGFCSGPNRMGASCPVPEGWESATVLDWGTGASEPVAPPLVEPGQGANPGCAMPCRVGEGGTLCS